MPIPSGENAPASACRSPGDPVPHDVVDLRSDTLTLPTPAMREAMARAEVGDDVWEEDPTVKRLEAVAAERLGKEARPFLAPRTIGNPPAGVRPTPPRPGVAPRPDSHIFNYEGAG